MDEEEYPRRSSTYPVEANPRNEFSPVQYCTHISKNVAKSACRCDDSPLRGVGFFPDTPREVDPHTFGESLNRTDIRRQE